MKNILKKILLAITTAFVLTGCVEIDRLMEGTKEMVSLNLTLTEYAKAQAAFAEALGLKGEAKLAKDTATKLENGELTGESSLDEVISNSQDIQNKINQKMESGVVMSEQSKEKFLEGIPHYVVGGVTLYATIKLAEEAKARFEAEDENGDFIKTLEKGIAGATFIYILSKTPKLLASFAESTSTMITFMTANNIDTKQLDTLADEMGD